MKRFFFSLLMVVAIVSAALMLKSGTALADPSPVACKNGIGYGSDSKVACASLGGVETDPAKIDATLNDPNKKSNGGQASCGGVKTSIDYGCGSGNGGPIYGFLRGIIKFVGGLIGLVVIMMLIIGGIRYITSAGDPKRVAAAKNQITNAIIGLVLFGLMLAILNFLLPKGIIG